MARRSAQDAAADVLYAQVPDVNCKGLCQASCGPVDMSHRERARIRETTGINIPTRAQMLKDGRFDCPALTDEGRCGAYSVRPMVCRAWGASEEMRCPWGCTPAEGEQLLTGAETYRLLAASMDAGGGGPDSSVTAAAVDKVLATFGDNAFSTPAQREFRENGARSDYYRAATQEIPAAFASGQVIGRYRTAFKNLAERQQRPYA